MNTGIKIVACSSLVAVSLTFAVFTAIDLAQPREKAPSALSAEVFTGARYVVGESGGNLAVYESGDMKNPMLVTNIRVNSLREKDRELVRSGIALGSDEELARLLEDFGS